jgi:hypothetical protein
MVLALFLLAAAMMVSGAAAVLFGSDIIMVERGWAMVISGATSFSAGAVLLGIAAMLRALERIGQDVKGRNLATSHTAATRAEPGALRSEPAVPPPIVLPGSVVAEPERPPVRTEPAQPVRTEPAAPAAPKPETLRPVEQAAELRAERADERPGPRFEAKPEPHRTLPNGSRPPEQSEILVAPDPPRIRLVEPAPEQSIRPEPPPETPPSEPPRAEPPHAPEPEPVTVVGKYSSGGNSYVMFSDGSIQADTPTGRHRFASLDELKIFVAGGGERS